MKKFQEPMIYGDLKRLRKLWQRAEDRMFEHIWQRSPEEGVGNSYMARVALLDLRQAIDEVLQTSETKQQRTET